MQYYFYKKNVFFWKHFTLSAMILEKLRFCLAFVLQKLT